MTLYSVWAFFNKAALTLTALTLVGCAAYVSEAPTARAKLAATVIIKAAQKPTRKARIIWERAAEFDIIEIKNPLGSTVAQLKINVHSGDILLNNRPLETQNLSAEARDWLDILPPPQSIGYWLLGQSDPNYFTRETRSTKATGIAAIRQHDWQVIYQQHNEAGLPISIDINNTQSLDIHINIRIRQWLSIP